jgi:cytochrome c-type biogenesis protein CcmE
MDVMGTQDDPESADAATVDLSPRVATPRSSRRPKGVLAYMSVGLVVIAIGFVVVNSLSGATTFFYNVDQAVKERTEIGDRRVRLQGNVIEDSIVQKASGVSFTLAYGGKTVKVEHTGDVPDLFQPTVPIVSEGKFSGTTFRSDKILVKHDASYKEANGERLKEADEDAKRNASASANS